MRKNSEIVRDTLYTVVKLVENYETTEEVLETAIKGLKGVIDEIKECAATKDTDRIIEICDQVLPQLKANGF